MKLLLKPFKFCIIIFLFSYFFQFFTPNLLFADNMDSKRSIRVGIFQNEPIVFQDEDGVAKGFYVDVLNEIARKENWDIEYILDSFSGGLDRIKTKDIDIMTCVAQTEPRDVFADFSGEVIWNLWGVVFVRPDSNIENIISLQGKKVAILKDGINGINFMKLCEEFNVTCEIQEMSSHDITLKAVESGESDAAVVNSIFGAMHGSEYNVNKTSIIFSPINAVFAFPEGNNRDLAIIIDSYLHDWKQDKDSVYNKSLTRWLMHRTVAVSVVPDWLIAGVTIILFIVLLLLIWARLLKRIVRRRTAQLQRSKTKYQSLYDNSPDMYVSVSPDNDRIQECNETLLQNTGYTREELIESPIFKMYHEDCMSEVKKAVQQFVEIGIIKDKELTLKRKDGSKLEVSLNMIAVKDNSGKILHSISSWRDITNRKKNEKEIENKSRELKNQLIKSEKHRIANLVILKDLNKTTTNLKSEISERKQAEEELKKRMNELEIFNDAAVNREMRIIELRKEVNEILQELGKEVKYEIIK